MGKPLTLITVAIVLFRLSMTEIELDTTLAVYILLLDGLKSKATGSVPTTTFSTSLLVLLSITDTGTTVSYVNITVKCVKFQGSGFVINYYITYDLISSGIYDRNCS